MDNERFDALIRGLGAGGARTRRSAIVAMAAAALFGAGAGRDAEAKRRRRRKRRKPFNRDACFGSGACTFRGGGKDYDDCDFSGSDVFAGEVAGGSSFRRADFRDAILDGADLQGVKFLNANLRGASLRNVKLGGSGMDGACLFDVDFLGADFGGGPVLANTFRCNTILPSGTVNNDHCDTAPRCCTDQDEG